jgi:hypothetical protein
MSKNSDKNAAWRTDQSDRDRLSLIADGGTLASVDLGLHTVTLHPGRPNETTLVLPSALPLLDTAEQRLNLPTLAIDGKPDSVIRALDREVAALNSARFPRHMDAGNCIEAAHELLFHRSSDASLSPQATDAMNHLNDTIDKLDRDGGRWSQDTYRSYEAAGNALAKLPPSADRDEHRARVEHQRAMASLVYVRTVREDERSVDQDLLKDPGSERDTDRDR